MFHQISVACESLQVEPLGTLALKRVEVVQFSGPFLDPDTRDRVRQIELFLSCLDSLAPLPAIPIDGADRDIHF